MSNSAANSAAKRRRGATQQPMSQSNQPNQSIAAPPTLTVPQSIYLLSNRINYLESQLQHAINNNTVGSVNEVVSENNVNVNNEVSSSNSSLNTDNFIIKGDFNDVMTSIGSDMNGLSQKMNTLNEFVLSVQNSYLGLNKAILEIQQQTTILNNSDKISMNINEKNSLADFNNLDESEENSVNIEEEEEAPAQAVSADITSRLKMLSVKSKESTDNIVEDVSDEEEEQA